MIWLSVIAILQGIFTLLDGIRAARHMRTFRPAGIRKDRILVFCPCKGIDAEFEKNVRSILDQDYPDYAVQFVVESDADEAFSALKNLGVTNVLVAGRTADRGQKVHNLAYAVQAMSGANASPIGRSHQAMSGANASPIGRSHQAMSGANASPIGRSHQVKAEAKATPADIYVFCDSDARFPRNWLSNLTAPLTRDNVATGYRWYVANRFHLPTLLRSAWNASSVSILGNHNRNFVWGGSMAMYRETFERLNILEAWRGALSDDYAVTRAAQRSSTPIIFVPSCLIPSYGECTWRELFEFTTRQIIITRVYHPSLWRIGFIGHVIFNAAFFILPFTNPLLWAVVYGLAAAKSWIRYNGVRTVVPPPALSGHGWFYILCAPLVALLYLFNMIRSALGTEIVWRQIHYKLVSPNETRVIL